MRKLGCATALFVAVLASARVFAQGDACQARENALLPAQGHDLTLKAITPCLGEKDRDTNELVKLFDDATPDVTTAADRHAAVVKAVNLLQQAVRQQLSTAPETEKSLWQLVDDRLSSERDLLNKIAATDIDSKSAWILPETFWTRLPQGQFGAINEAGLADPGVNAWTHTCDASATSCPSYQSRKALIRIVRLGARLGGYVGARNLQVQTLDAARMNARWGAYFHEALPQYWWEVWANGLRMDKNPKLCPHDADTGIQRGFCQVPENQLILLHPEAGLEWNSHAKSSGDLKPVFVIEALGWNRWRFEEGTAQMKQRFGASLIGAYGNRNGTSDWSYGLMVHAGRSYTLAATRNSHGDFGLLVNVNLMQKYLGTKEKYVDYLAALKKPSITTLLTGEWPPKLPKEEK